MPVVDSENSQIAYDVVGQGEPLLMIMGFATDSRMWMMQVPALSARYRCITFDNRGTGRSASGDGPLDLAMMAADARAVLDDLGVERAHVLGISMGGAIAQHLALDSPERVSSLVLAATWCSRNAYTSRIADLGLRIYDELGPREFIKASLLWLLTPRFLIERADVAAQLEELFADAMPPREAMIAQLEALLVHETRDRLTSLQLPTLVMVGRRDALVPPELSEEIAKAIPGAELRLLETAHAFNFEEVDAFNATVLEFLARQ